MFANPFFPFIFQGDKHSLRQFIDEDDVVKAVVMFTKEETLGEYEIYNLTPPDYLLFSEIGRIFKKITIPLPKFLVHLSWWLIWHLSGGKIPLSPDAINSFIYPIVVDGSKITRQTNFRYQSNSLKTLLKLKKKEKI